LKSNIGAGLESYKIDFYGQKVTVTGKVNREDVWRRIHKTGKRVTLIPKPDPPKKEEKKEDKKEEKKQEKKEEKKEAKTEEKKIEVTHLERNPFAKSFYKILQSHPIL